LRPIIGNGIVIPHIVRSIEAVAIITDCILRHLPVCVVRTVVGEELLRTVGRYKRELNKRGGVLVLQQRCRCEGIVGKGSPVRPPTGGQVA